MGPPRRALRRVRLPRFMDATGVIHLYSAREAEGFSRLWLLQLSGHAQGEKYCYHVPLFELVQVCCVLPLLPVRRTLVSCRRALLPRCCWTRCRSTRTK
jgi:hypothetical protein